MKLRKNEKSLGELFLIVSVTILYLVNIVMEKSMQPELIMVLSAYFLGKVIMIKRHESPVKNLIPIIFWLFALIVSTISFFTNLIN